MSRPATDSGSPALLRCSAQMTLCGLVLLGWSSGVAAQPEGEGPPSSEQQPAEQPAKEQPAKEQPKTPAAPAKPVASVAPPQSKPPATPSKPSRPKAPVDPAKAEDEAILRELDFFMNLGLIDVLDLFTDEKP